MMARENTARRFSAVLHGVRESSSAVNYSARRDCDVGAVRRGSLRYSRGNHRRERWFSLSISEFRCFNNVIRFAARKNTPMRHAAAERRIYGTTVRRCATKAWCSADFFDVHARKYPRKRRFSLSISEFRCFNNVIRFAACENTPTCGKRRPAGGCGISLLFKNAVMRFRRESHLPQQTVPLPLVIPLLQSPAFTAESNHILAAKLCLYRNNASFP